METETKFVWHTLTFTKNVVTPTFTQYGWNCSCGKTVAPGRRTRAAAREQANAHAKIAYEKQGQGRV